MPFKAAPADCQVYVKAPPANIQPSAVPFKAPPAGPPPEMPPGLRHQIEILGKAAPTKAPSAADPALSQVPLTLSFPLRPVESVVDEGDEEEMRETKPVPMPSTAGTGLMMDDEEVGK